MPVIGLSVGWLHIIIDQFLSCLFQSRCFGVGTDTAGFEILYPLFQRSDSYFIELIDTDKEILREYFGR